MGKHRNDVRAGDKIDVWNRTHGQDIQRQSGAALDAFITSMDQYEHDHDVEVFRAAGRELAEQMRDLQTAPLSGVPAYDGPRLEAMALYERAGDAAAGFDPSNDAKSGHEDAGALIARGREVLSVATQYTTDLVDRIAAAASSR